VLNAGCAKERCKGEPPAFELAIRVEPAIGAVPVRSLEVEIQGSFAVMSKTFDIRGELDDGVTTVLVNIGPTGAAGFDAAVSARAMDKYQAEGGGQVLAHGAGSFHGSGDGCNFFELLLQPAAAPGDMRAADRPRAPDGARDGPRLDHAPKCVAPKADATAAGWGCAAKAGWINVWPYATDATSCTNASGTPCALTGPGAATWFVFKSCGRRKDYIVYPGCELLIDAAGECGPACSLADINYNLSEMIGSSWVLREHKQWAPDPICATGNCGSRFYKPWSYQPAAGVGAIRVEAVGTNGFHVCVYGR
jgi:hypothetical protein